MRRLIINADDFGLTSGVNRAVVEAHERGVVTSATLMATGQAFEDAVQRAQLTPRLAVGCHLVLVDGSPLLSASQIPSLIHRGNNSAGGARFRDGITGFAALATTGQLVPEQIEAEAIAQIRRLQSTGLEVSHVDSHKHTHLFPQVLRPLLRAAKACGVQAIRNPFDPAGFSLVARRPSLWKRYGEVKMLGSSAEFRRAVKQADMLTPDGTVGIVATGAVDERLFRLAMESLPKGTWEFVCHPGYNDADLQNVQTRLRQSRKEELQILTAPATRELLAHQGIELISYRDLVVTA